MRTEEGKQWQRDFNIMFLKCISELGKRQKVFIIFLKAIWGLGTEEILILYWQRIILIQ